MLVFPRFCIEYPVFPLSFQNQGIVSGVCDFYLGTNPGGCMGGVGGKAIPTNFSSSFLETRVMIGYVSHFSH